MKSGYPRYFRCSIDREIYTFIDINKIKENVLPFNKDISIPSHTNKHVWTEVQSKDEKYIPKEVEMKEIKITVQINGIDTEIILTPEQVAGIEAQQKPKKFEWNYMPDDDDSYNLVDSSSIRTCGIYDYYIEHGRYRKSEEAADQSLARNKRANRLEALAEQLGGLKEWENGEDNYYIYRYGNSAIWTITVTCNCFYPESVYMTKNCAIEICRLLNEGLFSLDGEI